MNVNPRVVAIIEAINDKGFSLVVNEVYGGSITSKAIRCPGDIELARRLNDDVALDGILRMSKDEMLDTVQACGFALLKAMKGAGMEHKRNFTSTPEESPSTLVVG